MTSVAQSPGEEAAYEVLMPLLPFEAASAAMLGTGEDAAPTWQPSTVTGVPAGEAHVSGVTPSEVERVDSEIAVPRIASAKTSTRIEGTRSAYDQAVLEVLDLGRAVHNDKAQAGTSKAAHESALLTAIQLGRTLRRSLRDIARDTGTSPGQLSRLANCQSMLLATQPIWRHLTIDEQRERLTVSRVRHLLPTEPAVQRRGIEMLAARPCTESEVRDFVRAEIEAARPRAPKEHVAAPRWLVSLIRSRQLHKADVLDTVAVSSGHLVVRLEVELPMNRAALERVLPRGNTGRNRRAAA